MKDVLVLFKKKLREEFEIYLRIKVIPSSEKNEVKELLEDGTLKVNIAAAPEKGKANLELIKLIAKNFTVDKNCVKIISGAGSRLKLIKVKND